MAPAPRRGRQPRGAVGAMVLIALAMLVAFLASAMNIGHLMAARNELQNSGDAAALAGARALDGTANGLSAAPPAAVALGRRNDTDGNTVDLRTADTQVGHWDLQARTFTVLDPSQANIIQAVRVRPSRDDTRAAGAGAVVMNFANYLRGQETRTVGAESIAVGGGPSRILCAQMPIGLSQCYLTQSNCEQEFTIRFSNDLNDTAGWTTFELVASASNIRNLLQSSLNGQCTPLDDHDMANLTNGSVTSACDDLFTIWQRDPTHEWIVPVLDTGSCPPKFIQTAQVVTFAYMRITDMNCHGSPKYAHAILRCGLTAPPGSTPGGMFNPSVSPLPPALVQ